MSSKTQKQRKERSDSDFENDDYSLQKKQKETKKQEKPITKKTMKMKDIASSSEEEKLHNKQKTKKYENSQNKNRSDSSEQRYLSKASLKMSKKEKNIESESSHSSQARTSCKLNRNSSSSETETPNGQLLSSESSDEKTKRQLLTDKEKNNQKRSLKCQQTSQKSDSSNEDQNLCKKNQKPSKRKQSSSSSESSIEKEQIKVKKQKINKEKPICNSKNNEKKLNKKQKEDQSDEDSIDESKSQKQRQNYQLSTKMKQKNRQSSQSLSNSSPSSSDEETKKNNKKNKKQNNQSSDDEDSYNKEKCLDKKNHKQKCKKEKSPKSSQSSENEKEQKSKTNNQLNIYKSSIRHQKNKNNLQVCKSQLQAQSESNCNQVQQYNENNKMVSQFQQQIQEYSGDFYKQDNQNQIAEFLKNNLAQLNDNKKEVETQIQCQINIISSLPTKSQIQELYENLKKLIFSNQNFLKENYKLENSLKILIEEQKVIGKKYIQDVQQVFRTETSIKKDDISKILKRVDEIEKKLINFQETQIESFQKKVQELNTLETVNNIQRVLKIKHEESEEDKQEKVILENKLTSLQSDKLKWDTERKQEISSKESKLKELQSQLIRLQHDLKLFQQEGKQLEEIQKYKQYQNGGKSLNEVNNLIQIQHQRLDYYTKLLDEVEDKTNEQNIENNQIFQSQSNSFNHKILNSSDISKTFTRFFVADRSGSMEDAHKIVVDSIVNCTDHLKQNKSQDSIVVINFDDAAEVSFRKSKISTLDIKNFRNKISFFSGGGTNFVSAFSKLQEEITKLPDDEIPFVIFLTDGEDDGNCDDYRKVLDNILSQNENMIFFTLGLGSNINEQKLQEICNMMNQTKNCQKDFGNGYQDLYFKIKSSKDIQSTYVDVNINSNQHVQTLLEKKSLSRIQYEERKKRIEEWRENQISEISKQIQQIKTQLNSKNQLYENNKTLVEQIEKQVNGSNQKVFEKQQEVNSVQDQINQLNNEFEEYKSCEKFFKEKELKDAEIQYNQLVDRIIQKNFNNNEDLTKVGYTYASEVSKLQQDLKTIVQSDSKLEGQISYMINFVKHYIEQCKDMKDQIDCSVKTVKRLKNNDQMESHTYEYFQILYKNNTDKDIVNLREKIVTLFDTEIPNFIQENDIQTFRSILTKIDYLDISQNLSSDEIVKKLINDLYPSNIIDQFNNILKELKAKIKKKKEKISNNSEKLKKTQSQIDKVDEKIQSLDQKIEKATSQKIKENYISQKQDFENELNDQFEEMKQIKKEEKKIESEIKQLKKEYKDLPKTMEKDIQEFQAEINPQIELIERIIKSLKNAFKEATQYLFMKNSSLPIANVCRNIERINKLTF